MVKHFVFLLVLFHGVAHAQVRLTLQEAIAKTLQHNFDIGVADIDVQQAARNNTLGNAGFAPNVILSTSTSRSKSNVYNELASGAVQSNPKAGSTNSNPALTVNWTIFDGGRMFLIKKQLNEFEALSQVQLKAQIQTMVSRTIQMYAQVVWQRKQLLANSTAIALAKTRMEVSDLKFKTGASAKIDYLQARVDYNARRSDSVRFVANLTNAADSLNVLMGERENTTYIVDDSLSLNKNLKAIDNDRLRDINLSLSAYRTNTEISKLNAKIAKSSFLPTVTFNGGYVYNQTTNATGFALFSRSYGPNGMLSASIPVFGGGNLRRQSDVASLQVMRDQLLYEKQNTVVGRQYRTGWRNYQLAVTAYQIADENIGYAKENLDVQQSRFRLGVGTTLEVRQAENDYVIALSTLYTAAYDLKVNETVVLELENQLVKQ